MKYLITLFVCFAFIASASAQITAGKDDKAAGATIGKIKGYSYGITYTIKDGKVLDQESDKYLTEVFNTVPRVKAEKQNNPCEYVNDCGMLYCYEVTYTIKNGIVQNY
ncbi:MAG: hypothetical protein AB2L26_12545 [Ignavibacteria bacterium]